MSNFDTAINRLLGNEGGYSDGKGDPGGETSFGISKRSYPKLDIKALTRAQACALYKRDFWDRANLDSQPLGIAYQLLDTAVNSGMSNALRMLQRALSLADDGVIGPITLAAIKAATPHDLIMRFLAERITFMTNCSNWPVAGKGWSRRIATQLKFGAADV
jgi:lysozyme family protein